MEQPPRGTRREQAKQDTRRLILDAAYALFVEKGYEATTMRMLAGRAGVSPGAIFKHFPDKPAILAAAFQEDLGAVVQDAFATLPKQDFKAQLIHITSRIYSFYARNADLSRILVREALFLAGPRAAGLDGQLDAFLQAVAGLLQQAAARGELPASESVLDGALAFGSFYIAALIRGLKSPVFDAAGQCALVARMLDRHFPGPAREKGGLDG